MREIEIKELSPEAIGLHRFFASQPGSEKIANLKAIQAIFNILKRDKPARILEFGGGIGTLSYLCLKYSDAEIEIYENNDFCINALKNNLKEFGSRYKILTDYEHLNLSRDFYDFVIGDGGPYNLVDDIVKTAEIKRIFFEGRRSSLQEKFRRALKNKYYFRCLKYACSGGLGRDKAGYEIICWPERKRLKRIMNYIYWEIIMTRERMMRVGIAKLMWKKAPKFIRRFYYYFVSRLKSNR